MKITIEILDDAFENDYAMGRDKQHVASWLIRAVANHVSTEGFKDYNPLDANGNKIAEVTIEEG